MQSIFSHFKVSSIHHKTLPLVLLLTLVGLLPPLVFGIWALTHLAASDPQQAQSLVGTLVLLGIAGWVLLVGGSLFLIRRALHQDRLPSSPASDEDIPSSADLFGPYMEEDEPPEANLSVEMEEQLYANEAHLRKVQEVSNVGSWEWDFKTQRMICSYQLERIFGVPMNDFRGSVEDLIRNFVVEKDQERVFALARDIAAERQMAPAEITIRNKQGEERIVWLQGTPILDRNGLIHRLLVTVQDVTERKLFETQIFRKRNLESLGTLAGGIAHDFNNLLTAILGYVEVIKVSTQDDKTLSLTDKALTAGVRAKHLANRLLTFARGEISGTDRSVAPHIVQETCEMMLMGSRIKSDIRVESDVWPTKIDAGQLGQVIQNLISNARDAMDSQGELRIQIENRHLARDDQNLNLRAGDYSLIRIGDSGPGIASEDLPHVFDVYFSTKERDYNKGTGLGLSICHSIVTRHGGHISAHSRLGQGTEFEIWLPADRDASQGAAA